MNHKLQLLKALSDETRLKIIDLLLHNDYCVGALAYYIGISEASISQHLKVLRNAGIVTGEKRGYYTHYEINQEMIREAADSLMEMAEENCERKGCKFETSDGDHSQCRVYRKKREQTNSQKE